MTEITEVKDKKQLEQFVKFPFELYKGNRYWVPPLIAGEMATFDPEKNPNMQLSDVRLFLAHKDGKVAGRIAAIINKRENELLGIRKMRFGWMDFIDDTQVSSMLLETTRDWGKEHGIEYMEGPVGFTNLDKAALLTKGFEELSNTTTLYNYPYYASHMEKAGFERQTQWKEQVMLVPENVPARIEKFAWIMREKYRLSLAKLDSRKKIKKYIPEVFRILNHAYSVLDNFVPLTQEQQKFYATDFMTVINPDYVSCVLDENKNMIAFGVAIPYMGSALQKAKGKLFPFGWWHLMRALKKNDRAELILIGVHPDWQKKGVTALVFEQILPKFIENKIVYIESNPEQEQNNDVQALWKDYECRPHKSRWTFRRSIG